MKRPSPATTASPTRTTRPRARARRSFPPRPRPMRRRSTRLRARDNNFDLAEVAAAARPGARLGGDPGGQPLDPRPVAGARHGRLAADAERLPAAGLKLLPCSGESEGPSGRGGLQKRTARPSPPPLRGGPLSAGSGESYPPLASFRCALMSASLGAPCAACSSKARPPHPVLAALEQQPAQGVGGDRVARLERPGAAGERDGAVIVAGLGIGPGEIVEQGRVAVADPLAHRLRRARSPRASASPADWRSAARIWAETFCGFCWRNSASTCAAPARRRELRSASTSRSATGSLKARLAARR